MTGGFPGARVGRGAQRRGRARPRWCTPALGARPLAHHPGEVVAVDRLIDDVWRGEPAASALGVLQTCISNLRRVLEPARPSRAPAQVLVTRVPGYALLVQTDAGRFVELVNTGIERLGVGAADEARIALDAALELRRGEPFADFADEDWVRHEKVRLNELRIVALEHRCAAALSVGDVYATVPELEVLVAQHPMREGLWQLLALALYRTGRQADALQALSAARETLRDEFGLDPSPALRELEAAILEQSPTIGGGHGIVLTAPPSKSTAPPDGVARAEPSLGPDFVSVVGRDAQLAELRQAADRRYSGRLQTVVVSGEAGIGKTWLVEAFAEGLHREGWHVAWGRCHDTSGAPALWPWLQVLGELDRAHPLSEDLRALVSGTSDPATATENDAGDARFRQHDSIRRYLGAMATSRPLLVALDDLQWADIASLQLLADVLTVTRTARILAVVATRGGEDGDLLRQQALVRLDRAGGLRLALAGLDVAALDEMAGAAGHEVSGEQLLERTGGNPLFVREHLRLARRADTEADQARVPDSVGDLIRQRLSGLSVQTQSALRAASVLGRDIDVEAVVAISEQSEGEVWDAMDAGPLAGRPDRDPWRRLALQARPRPRDAVRRPGSLASRPSARSRAGHARTATGHRCLPAGRARPRVRRVGPVSGDPLVDRSGPRGGCAARLRGLGASVDPGGGRTRPRRGRGPGSADRPPHGAARCPAECR
jgi:DNA-binding SARP family transcriptional activator